MSDLYGELSARYLDLVAKSLCGMLYEDPPLLACGTDLYDHNLREFGADWPSNALTMIGRKRLDNICSVLQSVIHAGVPGDFVETGVWRGGSCIMACAVLAVYGAKDRKVVACDSFSGLPEPDSVLYPPDKGSTFHTYPELVVSLDEVKANFGKYGFLDDNVVFVEGWFRESMSHVPSEQIAVLRLDGDMYESTILPLNSLYDRISEGGWVIVDDYLVVPACKAAVQDFFEASNIMPELHQIDGVGVFFRKDCSSIHSYHNDQS